MITLPSTLSTITLMWPQGLHKTSMQGVKMLLKYLRNLA